MNKIEKIQQYEEAIEYLIETQATFEGYEYFSNQLWRKLKDRENADPREIRVFFTHLWLHHRFPEIWTSPCGMSWAKLWRGVDWEDGTPWTDDEENPVTEYFNQFKDIQEDFAKWQYEDYSKRR